MERIYILQLIDLHRKQLETQAALEKQLMEIAENTRPLAAAPLLTRRRIYKQEAIELLGVSERTYERYKNRGLLCPRGIGHDFYYPDDLETAMSESRKKGKT